ncbi:hypothetical protein L6452_37403 [Arctium lappa]|uniref:Uncharacterized protein n=1 Tax=Arctium lappa TaxID=4217 RepID=A0ACB8Y2W1_ARCLA|nr:hypothetical protein L6452_37403 [Arctium lappa]
MALNTNTNYYDNGSLSKPPRFSRDNFALWKNRMMLFIEGVDPTIPEYVANGPYEPFTIIATVPATATTPAIPERYAIKEIRQLSDKEKKKVGLDAKSSSDEEEVANLCLMVEIKEEVDEPIGTSMSYISSQIKSLSMKLSTLKAIAALKAEKATVEGWCKSSTKITKIIRAQIPANDKTSLGYHLETDKASRDCSILKFGMFVSSIPNTSSTQCSSSSNPIPEDLSKSSKLADKGKSICHP